MASPPADADLKLLTERREARAVLVIPEDFSRKLAAGRTADAQMLLDGTDASVATIILGYAAATSPSSSTSGRLAAGSTT